MAVIRVYALNADFVEKSSHALSMPAASAPCAGSPTMALLLTASNVGPLSLGPLDQLNSLVTCGLIAP